MNARLHRISSYFFGHFRPKRPILDSSLQKWTKRRKLSKKRLERLPALTKCKVSEKSNERFPRKNVTYIRMYGQTKLLRSQTTVGRETKTSILGISKFF